MAEAPSIFSVQTLLIAAAALLIAVGAYFIFKGK